MYGAYFFKVNWILEEKNLISQFADAVHQADAKEDLADMQIFQFMHLMGKLSYLCIYA